jgi:hypothetical protein
LSDQNTPAPTGAATLHIRFPFPQDQRNKAGALTQRGAKILGPGGEQAVLTAVVRELAKEDIEKAALLASQDGGNFLMAKLALATVKVNDQPLVTGDLKGWNSVAIEWLTRCFNTLNAVPEDIAEDLMGKGEVVPA